MTSKHLNAYSIPKAWLTAKPIGCAFFLLFLLISSANLAASTQIAAGAHHALAIKPDGSLWAWGDNSFGELGDNTKYTHEAPIQVGSDYSVASAGAASSAAIKTDGSLWMWGLNTDGQLGDGTTTDRLKPTKIGPGYKAVVLGEQHTVALKVDGSLWAWGDNSEGQLGDGSTTRTTVPKMIDAEFMAISAGGSHTVGIKKDGSLWTWGLNSDGQLGDGTTTNRFKPVHIGTGFVAIAAGYTHTAALKADGSLWQWGKIHASGSPSQKILTPLQIGTGYSAVAAGDQHILGLKPDGSLWSWGDNFAGQLGDGTTASRNSLNQIGSGYIGIAANGYSSYAINNDGHLRSWGFNYAGQLGNGDLLDRKIPSITMLESPPVPTGLTASTFENTQIVLTWKNPATYLPATSYKIYVNGQSAPMVTISRSILPTVGGAIAYYDSVDLWPSTTYSYTVAACYGDGINTACSTQSLPVSITTPTTFLHTKKLFHLLLTCPKTMGSGQSGICDARAFFNDGSDQLVTYKTSFKLGSAAISMDNLKMIKANTVATDTSVSVSASYSYGTDTLSTIEVISVLAPTNSACTGSKENTSVVVIADSATKKIGNRLDVRYCMKNFDTATGLDVYAALKTPDGSLLFMRHWANGEITFSSDANSFLTLTNGIDTTLPVLTIPFLPSNLPMGEYVFYAIQVPRGKDVMQSTNWVGQLAQARFTLQK